MNGREVDKGDISMTDLPHEHPSRRVKIAAASLALVMLIGLIGAWLTFRPDLRWTHQSTGVASGMPQDEFEARVRTYLLSHPEVIADAINALEARQGEQVVADAKAALKSRGDELFRDADSPVGGNPNGDVTLVEFFDYNCPYWRMMAPEMTEAEAADPQLRIVYKEFPILGPNSVFAAKAALAAQKQGKYVALHRALYQARAQVDEMKVLEVAGQIGLDVDRMKTDMQAPAVQALLEKNAALAQALQITGTPGFVIGDQIATGAIDLKSLQSLIRGARGGQREAK
jgi:protein-disulfide isomerase